MLRHLRKPDPERFTARVLEAFRGGGVDGGIEIRGEQFTIVLPSGTRCFLGNLYRDYLAAWPWQRGAVLDRYVEMALTVGAAGTPPFEEVASRILPGARDTFLGEYLRLQSRLEDGDSPSFPERPLGPRMRAYLYIDEDDRTQMIGAEQLTEWEIEEDAAFTLAVDNLRARSTGGGWSTPMQGLHVSTWNDCYDASRLLLPELFRGLEVEGDLVALAPNWNTLMVVGLDDDRALGAALQAAERGLEDGRTVSGLPIVFRWPEWRPLELPRGHPCHEALERLRIVEMSSVYADQQSLLEDVLAAEERDLYVAPYSALRDRRSGELEGYTLWARGVDALLPEAPAIVFVEEPETLREEGAELEVASLADEDEDGESHTRIDWDIAWLHCAEQMQATEHHPRRWLVESFPVDAAMASMRRAQRSRDGD